MDLTWIPPWLPISILQIFTKLLCFQYCWPYMGVLPTVTMSIELPGHPYWAQMHLFPSSEERHSWQRQALEQRPADKSV